MEIVHHHFSTLDSTNNCAKRNAHLFDPTKITLITADEQTAGRGRAKRRWVSPRNQNIYATFSFFCPKDQKDILNASQIIAISTCYTLETLNFEPQLKWPNDILLEGKKLGGILCETTIVNEKLCMICGIGLNINMALDLLKEIDIPAISLMVQRGTIFDIQIILTALKRRFAEDLQVFLSKGFSPYLPKFKDLTTHMVNTQISFHDNQHIWEGVLDSINDDASINLRLPSQEIKRFVAGEILFKEKVTAL
jgi:BirA family biotin operon repressor/biotin-[acetyl-CoA-carboxylase] ligase